MISDPKRAFSIVLSDNQYKLKETADFLRFLKTSHCEEHYSFYIKIWEISNILIV